MSGDPRYNQAMFFVEIFLLLIFTVLCGILLALWRIRELIERLTAGGGTLAATAAAGGAGSTSRPPVA